jgi:PAS domain S-box-containing protein
MLHPARFEQFASLTKRSSNGWEIGFMQPTEKLDTSFGSGSVQPLRAFADAMPEVVWIANPQGRIEYQNARWREVTGISPDDIGHESWLGALHSDDRGRFLDQWHHAVTQLQPFNLEFRLWCSAHREHRWQLGCARPLRDSGERILAWVGSCQDIHDEKTARALLETSEARLRAVIDQSPVGIILLDPTGNPVYFNQKCAELRGNEVELANWSKAVHPDDQDRLVKAWSVSMATGRPWEEVYRFLHADGGTVWVSGRAIPVRSGDELIGWVRTLEDVTRMKTAEENLQVANEHLRIQASQLEHEVQQRTAEMREALVELDKLSYSIVHDMRAPLRTLTGFSKLLLDQYADRLDEQGKDFLQRIAAAAQRQDRLIQDVLIYHSYVRNDFPLQPVDLDALVAEILGTYANLQPPKVRISVRRPLGWAMAHETLLCQCVSALLSNAAKFVPPGVTPEISVWSESNPKEIKLWVQDNGIGIAPEHYERIFDIFVLLNAPGRYPGTGIGLPLAKKALERMQGSIGVKSEVGRGSRFWIALRPVSVDQ